MPPKIQIKRAYDPPAKSDGYRVLVDRVWPRGVRKDDLKLDEWAKDLAPSTKLRQWFGHDPERWREFRKRYQGELKEPDAKAAIRRVMDAAKGSRTITLVYSAKDEEHNQAVVLSKVLNATYVT
jgi:uncharacterized protein YeaO (DUF488 family)